MAFLRNDAINRVNLHSGIQAFAHSAGGIFFVAFLLSAGVSISMALLAQAAIVAGRFVLRPAVLPIAIRFGLKPLLILGTLGVALQYPMLAIVDGLGWRLFALCAVVALAEIFYWLSYNAYFAALGDAEHRGHQIGVREALVALAGIIAPLLGSWALLALGPHVTFGAVGLIQAAAVLPLIGAPTVSVARDAPGTFKAARVGMLLIAADGWFDACYIIVWQIALFVSLGQDFTAYGGAMALAGLVGAVFGLLLGRHIDRGHGRRAVIIAAIVATLAVFFRAASLGLPGLAVIANALGAILWPLLIPTLGTAIYNLAKTSPCPFRFQMATEGGWDVGCFGACLIAALLIHSGVSLSTTMLLALPAIGATTLILWRYYPALSLRSLRAISPAQASPLPPD